MTAIMAAIRIVTMTESLTYKELAERLGIKLASARRTAMRKKWQRVKGNDGETRVLVPLEVLERRNDNHDDNRDDNHNVSAIKELQAKIEALNELLVSERQRADACEKRAVSAESDRDRWHAEATRPLLRRLFG